jgi:hypothetical protein
MDALKFNLFYYFIFPNYSIYKKFFLSNVLEPPYLLVWKRVYNIEIL